jgi:hypothetical protein
VKDYVVESGPLKGFQDLYDERRESLRRLAEYHVIRISPRAEATRRAVAEMKRTSDLVRELRFVSGLFAGLNQGQHSAFGMRDVSHGKAERLAHRLKSQNRLRWKNLKYGISEDDFVLVELKDFAGDFTLLSEFAPPDSGDMIFCLSAPYDLSEVYWERMARGSAKAKEDRFHQEAAAAAHHSQLVVCAQPDGSYMVVLHPGISELSHVQDALSASGQKVDMNISFAPTLFS